MWVLVASLVDYYGLLDIGMSQTLQRFVARLRMGEQRTARGEVLSAAGLLSCIVGGVILVLSLGVAAILPRFLSLAGSQADLFRWLALLMGLSIGLLFPARALGAYLCGLERFDLYNLAAIVCTVLRAILFVVLLYTGHGVFALAAATLAIAGFSLLLHWRLVVKAERGVTFRVSREVFARIRELLSFSFYG